MLASLTLTIVFLLLVISTKRSAWFVISSEVERSRFLDYARNDIHCSG